MITKDPTLDTLAAAYTARACDGLGIALEDFSEKNADATLAASIMLMWASPGG